MSQPVFPPTYAVQLAAGVSVDTQQIPGDSFPSHCGKIQTPLTPCRPSQATPGLQTTPPNPGWGLDSELTLNSRWQGVFLRCVPETLRAAVHLGPQQEKATLLPTGTHCQHWVPPPAAGSHPFLFPVNPTGRPRWNVVYNEAFVITQLRACLGPQSRIRSFMAWLEPLQLPHRQKRTHRKIHEAREPCPEAASRYSAGPLGHTGSVLSLTQSQGRETQEATF